MRLQSPQMDRCPAPAEEEAAVTPAVGCVKPRQWAYSVSTPVRCRLIGTNRDLKNLVSRTVSRAFGRSTSATVRFSASPARKPAP